MAWGFGTYRQAIFTLKVPMPSIMVVRLKHTYNNQGNPSKLSLLTEEKPVKNYSWHLGKIIIDTRVWCTSTRITSIFGRCIVNRGEVRGSV